MLSHMEAKIWHKWTYLPNRNRLTDIENKLMIIKGRTREGINYTMGLRDTYHFVQNNKDLLYSTGNYSEYIAIINNGKILKIYMYNWITVLTHHCKS